MKKYITLLCMALSAATLVSCSNPTTSSPDGTSSNTPNSSTGDFNMDVPSEEEGDPAVASAISKLRTSNYHVKTVSKIEVKYPNSQPSNGGAYTADIFSYKTVERTYQNEGEKGVIESTSLYHGDLDKTTGKPIEGSSSSAQLSETAPVTYFRSEDGGIYSESIDYSNKVSKLITVEETIEGYYNPLAFDVTFANPWDYISAKDVTVTDGTWNLDLDKATFLLKSYASLSGNILESAVINKDGDGNITDLSFKTIDSTGKDPAAESYFVRTNTFEVTYTEVGTASVPHKTAFANSNPELGDAFTFIKDQFTDTKKRNFTYTKAFKDDKTSTESYYSPDDGGFVYFAQKAPDYTNPTGKPYEKGDNYDFRVYFDSANNNYMVQNYLNNGGGFGWASIAISGSALYTIDTFEGIGPRFFNLGQELFKPYVVDGKTQEHQYVIEDDLLQGAGEYFDNQMLGVHTDQFSKTTKLIIDLTDWNGGKGSMVVHTSYRSGTTDHDVDFTLSNVGTTTLPPYAKNGIQN